MRSEIPTARFKSILTALSDRRSNRFDPRQLARTDLNSSELGNLIAFSDKTPRSRRNLGAKVQYGRGDRLKGPRPLYFVPKC